MSLPRPLRRSASVPLALALLGSTLTLSSLTPSSLTPSAQASASRPSRAPAAPGEVRGYLDAHTHLMAYEAFGGQLMCGKPFDPRGIAAALRDCPDHAGNGVLAVWENFTRHGTPLGTHDPVGWPTFKDWPAWDSRTHQQAYHTWLERSWRAGQRILVNHLVANRQLCEIYPLKRTNCDEMDTIRRQARRMRELEAYIDEKSGGPGRGWFRIVRNSSEARAVAAEGKLAVVLGVEASEPFGCRTVAGRAQCTREDIDRGLDEMKRLGVGSMFVCHKYDNALCGVRFDGGVTGAFVNLGNFLGTGRFWQVEKCTGQAHDHTIAPAGAGDALNELLRLLGRAGVTLPLYPSPPHCNVHGLTDLGEYMVRGMMKRHMIVEVDHMSVKAADATLDLLEEARYPGVISSHSWTDETYLPRIYRLGGMVTGYGHAADAFIAEWKRNRSLRDPGRPFGYGYGLDANGMGALPPPRANSGTNPLRYPYTSPFDPSVKLDRQRTGLRTWDVNTDGVANYGLVPDWLADMKNIGDPQLITDLSRGAETYLTMWHRTESHGLRR